MTLSDVSIRKPVFAWMLMIGLIVFGAISFLRMGISRLPDVDFPVLNIAVTWIGASPETMESAVVDVLENSVMTVEGLRKVTSQMQEGSSNTTIEFEIGRDIDVALQEVQAKIAQAQRTLPDSIDPPIVTKSNPEDQPILWAALTGGRPKRDMVIFARDQVQDRITTVPGVGDVRLGGYVEPNMRIWIDNAKLRQLEVTAEDAMESINQGTLLTPSGTITSGPKEINVNTVSEALTPEDFENMPIAKRGGSPIYAPIRLRDVGRAELGTQDVRRISRFNGEPSVSLGVVKQRGSNAVSVGDAVRARVEEIKKALPKGLNIQTVIDTTKFIRESTHELFFTLTLSVILTSFVCYLFFGSFGSALNVILAIPVSLIGSFIVLHFAGFTINTFTLLALSLSIGIVVDDAIMVLENIVRHFEAGKSRVQAALVGAREITGAATAATIAIIAIFLPVIFMRGIVGKYFLQFGVAMSVVVALSLLEAVTLAPMRCSEFLTRPKENRLNRTVNAGLDGLVRSYRRVLEWCLGHRWIVIGVATAAFASSLFLVPGIKKEFVPAQDQSYFTGIVYTQVGSSLDYTDEIFRKLEALLKDRPEVDSYLVAVGGFQGGLVNQGNIFIVLKDPDLRPVKEPFKKPPSQQEFMAWTRKAINGIEGVQRAAVQDPSQQGFSAGRSFPISFAVQGPDWQKLGRHTSEFMEKMRQSGLMTDIDTDFNPNMPEARVVPDREAAARYGVSVETIANTINAMIGSLPVTKYTDETGHRDDVRIKLEEQDARAARDIALINVRNNYGEIVPLSKVVKIEPSKALMTISRYNRQRSTTINANPAPGASQADALAFVDKTAKEILPAGYNITISGSAQTYQESFRSLWGALALGIFVAYMVLASQYNSFIHPVTILLALPFSFTGAFIAMRVSGNSLNIYSMIGLLLLMGIVKKNSILLVDFTNHQRREGKDVHQALLEACPMRLRPILMTSLATVAAAIPAALALGPGAETIRPMAIVVIGGVILSTLLTLVVVPCAYSLFANFEGHRHEAELAEALTEAENLRRMPSAAPHSVPHRS